MIRCFGLLYWIVALEVLGFLSGFPKGASADVWYASIHKAPLSPPPVVFGVVWPMLYAMIAICGWKIWTQISKAESVKIKAAFILQLILNLSWTSVFFYLRLVDVGFWIIVAIILLVAYLIYATFSKCRQCAYLLMPYFIWLLFALYLNGYVWMHN